MYVVEAVPDSKRNALAVVTAYIQKNSGSEGTVLNISQSEPQLTPETPQRSSTPAASNITQGAAAVNSESQGDDGLGAANAGFDPVSRWQESAGRYHPVNEAAAQTTLEGRGRVPTDVPVTDVVGGQVSKHVSTLVNANITTNEMASALMEDARKGAFSAQPYTDAEAAAKVREHIEQVGWGVAFGEYRADIMSGKASKDISMTGIVLYNNAVNSGALLDAMDVSALMAFQSTHPLRGATAKMHNFSVHFHDNRQFHRGFPVRSAVCGGAFCFFWGFWRADAGANLPGDGCALGLRARSSASPQPHRRRGNTPV